MGRSIAKQADLVARHQTFNQKASVKVATSQITGGWYRELSDVPAAMYMEVSDFNVLSKLFVEAGRESFNIHGEKTGLASYVYVATSKGLPIYAFFRGRHEYFLGMMMTTTYSRSHRNHYSAIRKGVRDWNAVKRLPV